jgi:hypothetical protein
MLSRSLVIVEPSLPTPSWLAQLIALPSFYHAITLPVIDPAVLLVHLDNLHSSDQRVEVTGEMEVINMSKVRLITIYSSNDLF